jgi:HEAT repeat protein
LGLQRITRLAPADAAPDSPVRADELLRRLDGADVGERRRAARALARWRDSSTALGARLLVEDDATVREALFTSLAEHATPDAVDALLPLLRSEDAALRNGAIEALAEMPTPTGPRVEELLADPDSDVRIMAVNLLGSLRHEAVTRWLAAVLARETQVNVVCAAIEVLAEVGSEREVPALRAAADRFGAEPFVRFAADAAIARMVPA